MNSWLIHLITVLFCFIMSITSYAHLSTKAKVDSNGCHVCTGTADKTDKFGKVTQYACKAYNLSEGQTHCHLYSGDAFNTPLGWKRPVAYAFLGAFSAFYRPAEESFLNDFTKALEYISLTEDKKSFIIASSQNDLAGEYSYSGTIMRVSKGIPVQSKFLGVQLNSGNDQGGLYSAFYNDGSYRIIFVTYDRLLLYDEEDNNKCAGHFEDNKIILYCGSDFANKASRQTPLSKANVIVKMEFSRTENHKAKGDNSLGNK